MVDDRNRTDGFAADDLAAAGAMAGRVDPGYTWPEDPATLAALERWQDLRFGVIMHWGLYTGLGQGGSWSLCRENSGAFMDPPADWVGTEDEYQSYYYASRHSFSGAGYDAAEWAAQCARAGMKYLVFTSKHHDGFAMYDTAYSSLKSTAFDVPLRRDVLRESFDAFRAEGMETGVYFSKADWGHPGYWDPAQPVADRFHNYDRETEPEKWQSFVDYTHLQIRELLTNYGDVNVLWLDGGWVAEPAEPIDIDSIARDARDLQPNILVVDREVHGRNENYRTPEQSVPETAPEHPWESCITFTRSWCSMRPEEETKPIGDMIHTLVRVVGRGGNLLLGVGPDADGKMSYHIASGLAEIGAWMDINAEAIHGSRQCTDVLVQDSDQDTNGARGEWHCTRGERGSGRYIYAMRLLAPGEQPPTRLTLSTELKVIGVQVLQTGGQGSLDGVVAKQLTTHPGHYELRLPAVTAEHAVVVRVEVATAE